MSSHLCQHLNESAAVRWYTDHVLRVRALRMLYFNEFYEDVNTFYKTESQLHCVNAPFFLILNLCVRSQSVIRTFSVGQRLFKSAFALWLVLSMVKSVSKAFKPCI